MYAGSRRQDQGLRLGFLGWSVGFPWHGAVWRLPARVTSEAPRTLKPFTPLPRLQRPHRQFRFLPAYIPRLRSCRSLGAFITAPLPPVLPVASRAAGPLRSTGVTPLPRYYEPIRHPLVVGRLPGATGYTAYPASALSGRDEEGFSSCSLCPCRRAVAHHPAGVTRRVHRRATCPAAFAPLGAGSASGVSPFRGHHAFPFVTARRLAPIPRMGLSMGFRSLGFPPACHPATGLPIVTPTGLTPAGHSSLSWTHTEA
jgi:hypothetical protein